MLLVAVVICLVCAAVMARQALADEPGSLLRRAAWLSAAAILCLMIALLVDSDVLMIVGALALAVAVPVRAYLLYWSR